MYATEVIALFHNPLIEIEFETRQEKEAFIKWVLEPSMPSEERKCLRQIREKQKQYKCCKTNPCKFFKPKMNESKGSLYHIQAEPSSFECKLPKSDWVLFFGI